MIISSNTIAAITITSTITTAINILRAQPPKPLSRTAKVPRTHPRKTRSRAKPWSSCGPASSSGVQMLHFYSEVLPVVARAEAPKTVEENSIGLLAGFQGPIHASGTLMA